MIRTWKSNEAKDQNQWRKNIMCIFLVQMIHHQNHFTVLSWGLLGVPWIDKDWLSDPEVIEVEARSGVGVK